jgi:hypothetical protein
VDPDCLGPGLLKVARHCYKSAVEFVTRIAAFPASASPATAFESDVETRELENAGLELSSLTIRDMKNRHFSYGRLPVVSISFWAAQSND